MAANRDGSVSTAVCVLLVACSGSLRGAADVAGSDAGQAADAAADAGGQSVGITILSPTPNQSLSVAPGPGTPATFEIAFTVSNLTPTLCGGDCGTVTVVETTDGGGCDQPDSLFNDAFPLSVLPGTEVEGPVRLDLCQGGVLGQHTTKLELHNADNSLFTCSGACPGGVSASVSFDVTSFVPLLTVTSPPPGSALMPDTGGAHLTVPIEFNVAGFRLASPGDTSCTSAANDEKQNCGSVQETTDGSACDAPNAPFNVTGVTSSPASVWLDLCSSSMAGAHTTRLELHNSDDSLYTCNGLCPPGVSATISYSVLDTVIPSVQPFGLGGTVPFAFVNKTGSALGNVAVNVPAPSTGAFVTVPYGGCTGTIVPNGECDFQVGLSPQGSFCGGAAMTVTSGGIVLGWAWLTGTECGGGG